MNWGRTRRICNHELGKNTFFHPCFILLWIGEEHEGSATTPAEFEQINPNGLHPLKLPLLLFIVVFFLLTLWWANRFLWGRNSDFEIGDLEMNGDHRCCHRRLSLVQVDDQTGYIKIDWRDFNFLAQQVRNYLNFLSDFFHFQEHTRFCA